jgi:hypothetical protein
MEEWKMNRKRNPWTPATALFLAIFALAFPRSVKAETYYLRAAPTTLTLPGGTTVPMWGFALDSGVAVDDGSVSVPGPRLTVSPGQPLTVVLKNRLPASAGGARTDLSLLIPGAIPDSDPAPVRAGGRIVSFLSSVPSGANGAFAWSNLPPGTYLYHSGTHPQVHVQMGLYGAVTKDAAPGQAYPGIAYDADRLFVFSEVDPALHAAVAAGSYGTPPFTSTMDYDPRFFLLNGQPFPDTPSPAPVSLSDRVLLRFVNAGLLTHVPHLQGLDLQQVAEGGHPFPYARLGYSLALGAGTTADALLVPPQFSPGPCNIPLYDRALHLTNGASTGGGLLTYLSLTPPGGPPVRVGDTLMVTRTGSDVELHWTDLPGASSYRIYSGTVAGPGDLPSLEAVAESGSAGVVLPLAPGGLVFYQVTALGACAGEGPQK